jgi:hypothetical protein
MVATVATKSFEDFALPPVEAAAEAAGPARRLTSTFGFGTALSCFHEGVSQTHFLCRLYMTLFRARRRGGGRS